MKEDMKKDMKEDMKEDMKKETTIHQAKNDLLAGEDLNLVQLFADTWYSLEAYDKAKFPKNGWTKKQVFWTAEELKKALAKLKQELLAKKQATDLFGQERTKNAVEGIASNIFQSFSGRELYPSVEDKAAHLLYFMVKNHPFTDGNKRSGAFAFVWFLKKAGRLSPGFTPEALTALTLLTAESAAKDKAKMIGLILLLLQENKGRANK